MNSKLKLYFNNPVFIDGSNVTVRRGHKWNVGECDDVELCDPNLLAVNDKVGACRIIQTQLVKFSDIMDCDLELEHDKQCRTPHGLFYVMGQVYPGFDAREIVTLVTFIPEMT